MKEDFRYRFSILEIFFLIGNISKETQELYFFCDIMENEEEICRFLVILIRAKGCFYA